MYYGQHEVLPHETGVNAYENPKAVSDALGKGKALIMERRGLMTVGGTMHGAVSYYLRLEHLCDAQLMAEASAKGRGIPLVHINEEFAKVRDPF
jgi:hypothetical protein